MYTTKPKPSHHLVLISVLSGSWTLLLSGVYIGLSILGLIFRFNCDYRDPTLNGTNPSDLFMDTVFRTYILSADCNSLDVPPGITSDFSVFVLNALTLTFSVLSLIAAIVLVSVMTSKSEVKWFKVIISSYVGISLSSFVVDLTFACHFGMDYTHLSNLMDSGEPSLLIEYGRLGAILFMTLTLKGFLGSFVNIVLITLLIIYSIEYLRQMETLDHSIHSLGALTAYGTKRQEKCSHPCEICQMPLNKRINTISNDMPRSNPGSQHNFGYHQDDDSVRSPRSLNQDYLNNNSSFDRSNSWQAAPSSRPFSYLDEMKRPPAPAPRPPASPSDSGMWRREPATWQPAMPPVPMPDYSPHSPRRLKSAMKPSYM